MSELNIKLPCNIGDTIYVVPSHANYGLNLLHRHRENNRVYVQTINEIRINRNGWYVMTCDNMGCQVDSLLGETWFFTREEAEKKLEELKGTYKELYNATS